MKNTPVIEEPFDEFFEDELFEDEPFEEEPFEEESFEEESIEEPFEEESIEEPFKEEPFEEPFEEKTFEEKTFEEKNRISCFNPECRVELLSDLVNEHQLLELSQRYPLFCDECTARYLNGGRFRINRRCPHFDTPIKPSPGECTYNTTLTRPVCQWWYECGNCYPGKHHIGVCVFCANICKSEGHQLKSRYGVFYCDKGSGYIIPEDSNNVFEKIING